MGPRTSRHTSWYVTSVVDFASLVSVGASYSPSSPVPTNPSSAAMAPPDGGVVHMRAGGTPVSDSHGEPVFSSEYNLLNTSPVTCSDRKSTRLNSSHLGISYAV